MVEGGIGDNPSIEGKAEKIIDVSELLNGPAGSNAANMFDAGQNYSKILENIGSFFKEGEGAGDTVYTLSTKSWTDNTTGERKSVKFPNPYDTSTYDNEKKQWVKQK